MAPSQWSFALFSCGWWSSGHTCSGGHCRHLLPQVPQREKRWAKYLVQIFDTWKSQTKVLPKITCTWKTHYSKKSIQLYISTIWWTHTSLTLWKSCLLVGFRKPGLDLDFSWWGFLDGFCLEIQPGKRSAVVLHHFCWRDIQYPLNFQGVFPRCIILHIHISHIWCINSQCICIVYESERWDMKEDKWCLKVYKYQNLKKSSLVIMF